MSRGRVVVLVVGQGNLTNDKWRRFELHQKRRYLRRRQIKPSIPEPRGHMVTSGVDATEMPEPARAPTRRRTNAVTKALTSKGRGGGRPPGFDRDAYKQRNTVERCISRLKQWRGLATRYERPPPSTVPVFSSRASSSGPSAAERAVHGRRHSPCGSKQTRPCSLASAAANSDTPSALP
ncbi:transposase [Streptomyces sp. NPDC002644]